MKTTQTLINRTTTKDGIGNRSSVSLQQGFDMDAVLEIFLAYDADNYDRSSATIIYGENPIYVFSNDNNGFVLHDVTKDTSRLIHDSYELEEVFMDISNEI